MKLMYILEFSLKNLLSRKTRAILTIAGVVIGVSAITFLTSLGYGFEKMTTSQIATNESLTIFTAELGDSDLLAINDEQIAKIKSIDGVDLVEPSLSSAGKASIEGIKTDIVVNGYSTKYLELNNTKLLKGQTVTESDLNKGIASTGLLKALNLTTDDYSGKKINIEVSASKPLSPSLEEGSMHQLLQYTEIVGVVDDAESAFIIVPYKTFQQSLNTVNYSSLKVKVKDVTTINDVKSKVEQLGFMTDYIGDTLQQINAFFTIFRYIIGGFGVIAMLVAVLGMLNTLTVSLLERTKEIGVLKSNGATKKVVWQLFLSEGLIISAIGGALGILFGIFMGESVNLIFNYYAQRNGADPVDFFYTPMRFVMMAMGFVIVVGFFTGLYPAGRATKIKVLDALKYE